MDDDSVDDANASPRSFLFTVASSLAFALELSTSPFDADDVTALDAFAALFAFCAFDDSSIDADVISFAAFFVFKSFVVVVVVARGAFVDAVVVDVAFARRCVVHALDDGFETRRSRIAIASMGFATSRARDVNAHDATSNEKKFVQRETSARASEERRASDIVSD